MPTTFEEDENVEIIEDEEEEIELDLYCPDCGEPLDNSGRCRDCDIL